MEILSWQIFIILGICSAALLFGRNGVYIAAGISFVWTILMIFANWLMVLQIATVALGTVCGIALTKRNNYKLLRNITWALSLIGLVLITTLIIAQWHYNKSARSTTTAQTRIQKAEDTAFDTLLREYEIRYPQIDPRSPQYDEKLTNEVSLKAESYINAGNTPQDALRKAITDFSTTASPSSNTANEVNQPSSTKYKPSSGVVTNGIWSPLPPNDGSPKFQRCWDIYYSTVSAAPPDIPIGEYSNLEKKAQSQMNRCIKN